MSLIPDVKVDLRDFKHSFQKLEHLDKFVSKALDRVGEVVQREVQATTLIKHRGTDGLLDNIKIVKNGDLSVTVLADKDYAYYVEFGNNPGGDGFIRPRKAQALHFYINGHEVFAKKVKSYQGTHFFEKAVEAAKPEIEQILTSVFAEMFK